MTSLVTSLENCATYNADAISGMAHIVALVQTKVFGVSGGKIVRANATNNELCMTRVGCRDSRYCKLFKYSALRSNIGPDHVSGIRSTQFSCFYLRKRKWIERRISTATEMLR